MDFQEHILQRRKTAGTWKRTCQTAYKRQEQFIGCVNGNIVIPEPQRISGRNHTWKHRRNRRETRSRLHEGKQEPCAKIWTGADIGRNESRSRRETVRLADFQRCGLRWSKDKTRSGNHWHWHKQTGRPGQDTRQDLAERTGPQCIEQTEIRTRNNGKRLRKGAWHILRAQDNRERIWTGRSVPEMLRPAHGAGQYRMSGIGNP